MYIWCTYSAVLFSRVVMYIESLVVLELTIKYPLLIESHHEWPMPDSYNILC